MSCELLDFEREFFFFFLGRGWDADEILVLCLFVVFVGRRAGRQTGKAVSPHVYAMTR